MAIRRSRAPTLAGAARTVLEKGDGGGLYRFESLDGGFTADLPVDPDGLVLDYPGLFKRALP